MKRSAKGSGNAAKIIVAGVFLAVVLSASAYGGQLLGSLLFAKLEKIPTDVVGFTTLYHYWIAYGDIGMVRRALGVSSVIAAIVTVAPIVVIAVVVATAYKRELHGSARFANAREIRESGLVGND
jgi:type IV secretory pathway TraG/TraD family ATPase VirD4